MAKNKTNDTIHTLAGVEEQYLLGSTRDSGAIDWGWRWLDEGVGPMLPGGMYFVAARPTTGKSFAALRLLLHCREPSLYVSCEDPLTEIGRRVEACTNSKLFRDTDKERVRVVVPETSALSSVVSLAERARKENGCRVVAIDYLQIVRDDSGWNTFDRAGQVRNTISVLKSMGRANNQAILMLAQLRRPGEGMTGSDRGTIFDIRDSSDAENQAEAVLLMHATDRTHVDITVGKAKSRLGGQRRKLVRGVGGFLMEEAEQESREASEDPF